MEYISTSRFYAQGKNEQKLLKSLIRILWKRQSNMGQNELGRKRKHFKLTSLEISAVLRMLRNPGTSDLKDIIKFLSEYLYINIPTKGK